ncbi:cyclic nucleotide-binding domain-containing protein [Tepidimonas charontis]|uniref:Cyclic nucleotide-binding domain protein n=1 Tax=Tepidimonas charontis TaxID=2267262 RepID=A0A554XEP1_9BURK|nr:cyclic nucleotide-binding domain-containing protein [Tepidimonas charontis]TSE34311.1 Cyclic nucleotide-binding domain protein [Tepidimonas charontis]
MLQYSRTRCAECIHGAQCLLAPAAVQGAVAEVALRAGEPLLRQGEPLHQVAVVKVGVVLLRRRVPDAGRQAVAVVGPAQALGLRALLDCGVAAADAQALTPVRACLSQAPAPAIDPRVALAEGVRLAETLAEWAAIARLPRTVARVEAALARLAAASGTREIVLPERAVLAELCACAPETVSRAVTTLLRSGRLQRGPRRGQVRLVETEAAREARSA